MTLQQAIAFAIVAGMMAMFFWGKLRYDLVAVLTLLIAIAAGIVPHDKAFSGFSDDIVIIVASALVVSAAVARSGVIERIVHRVDSLPDANRPAGCRPELGGGRVECLCQKHWRARHAHAGRVSTGPQTRHAGVGAADADVVRGIAGRNRHADRDVAEYHRVARPGAGDRNAIPDVRLHAGGCGHRALRGSSFWRSAGDCLPTGRKGAPLDRRRLQSGGLYDRSRDSREGQRGRKDSQGSGKFRRERDRGRHVLRTGGPRHYAPRRLGDLESRRHSDSSGRAVRPRKGGQRCGPETLAGPCRAFRRHTD